MEQPSARPSEVLARQVELWRKRRKLSAQALANRLAELGSETLNRRSISKIENGDRGVSLDEWLQLAHALAVPPPLLFLDLESGQRVEIAPAAVLHPWLAWEWVTGEEPPVVTGNLATRVEEFAQARTTITLYRKEITASEAIHRAESDIAAAEYTGDEQQLKSARFYRVEALRVLGKTLDEMVEHDMALPGLPATWVEAMRSLKALKHLDRVPIAEGSTDGR